MVLYYLMIWYEAFVELGGLERGGRGVCSGLKRKYRRWAGVIGSLYMKYIYILYCTHSNHARDFLRHFLMLKNKTLELDHLTPQSHPSHLRSQHCSLWNQNGPLAVQIRDCETPLVLLGLELELSDAINDEFIGRHVQLADTALRRVDSCEDSGREDVINFHDIGSGRRALGGDFERLRVDKEEACGGVAGWIAVDNGHFVGSCCVDFDFEVSGFLGGS